MPVHTVPSYEGTEKLRALVDELDSKGEPIVSVLSLEGSFIVVTSPQSRATGRTEKRPAAKKQESR